MVIGSLLAEGTRILSDAGIPTARLDAELLLASLLGRERLYLALHRKEAVAEDVRQAFLAQIARREKHEPLAYIVGCKEFMSLSFSVGPGVLIPRPDTETLVEFVIRQLSDVKEPHILDICTGSGAIAISLAHYLPESRVEAWDIEEVCIETARKNATSNGVAERVSVIRQDALAPLSSPKTFDAVVSNPPYIPDSVVAGLMPEVRAFEPHIALCGGTDGLLFYRQITKNAVLLLKSGGLLAYEIGYDQADAVTTLLRDSGAFSDIGVLHDLADNPRVVYGRKK
ncbi:MAG: peptide chain release factor N(5)-glutamine methyltransferase [Ruminococcaceae bacterium]|nr:peptide chain release factor N(5)-glutamine methyltransferase [Oscillospiraceae bacterium]